MPENEGLLIDRMSGGLIIYCCALFFVLLISSTAALFQGRIICCRFSIEISKPVLKFDLREPGGFEWLQKIILKFWGRS
jgi:hypothetical protein